LAAYLPTSSVFMERKQQPTTVGQQTGLNTMPVPDANSLREAKGYKYLEASLAKPPSVRKTCKMYPTFPCCHHGYIAG
jgi:hypothetical protein